MNPPEFWPNTHAFGGFLLTARDSMRLRSTMIEKGAVRREIGGRVAYLWNFPTSNLLFTGTGVVDGKFVRGPAKLTDNPASMVGYCATIDLGDVITVRADEFGMYPLFYSNDIITDRLHLAMLAAPEIDVPAALSMFHDDWMFAHQLTAWRTPVAGFRMLGVGEQLKLDRRVSVERNLIDYEPLKPDEYHQLIRKGADEIRANLSAALDANQIVTFAITGGRDSRVNLAALVSLGRVNDVQFTTKDIDDDLPIGSGLVKWAGGSYCRKVPVDDWATLTFDEVYDRRRSLLFGTYHPVVTHHLQRCFRLHSEPGVLIGGGMGEAFRTMYVTQRFGVEHAFDTYSYSILSQPLRHHCIGEQFFTGLFDRISPLLKETFDRLKGETIGERLDDHYFNFRNRIHFRALHQASVNGEGDFHPLMSPSLLRASRGLPYSEKVSQRVIYDVTRALSPELARFPYDKPWRSDMTRSAYFDPSAGPADPLPLDAAPDLVEQGYKQTPRPLRPRPQLQEADEEMHFITCLATNLDLLSSSPFKAVAEDRFLEFLRWVRKARPRQFRCVASKVQSLADYYVIAGS